MIKIGPEPCTLEEFRACFPGLPEDKAEAYFPLFLAACKEFEITTPERLAAFMGQLCHESNQLRSWVELASGKAYEGRQDLGNTEPGDGPRYKGRGPIQLTGRANYRAAGRALGVDLEGQPELAATPDVGFRVAGWYWATRGLNALADAGDYRAITLKINGGLNGYADRVRHWHRCRSVLGLDIPTT